MRSALEQGQDWLAVGETKLTPINVNSHIWHHRLVALAIPRRIQFFNTLLRQKPVNSVVHLSKKF